MRKIFCVIAICFMLAGCASTGGIATSPDQFDKQATCETAKATLDTSVAMLAELKAAGETDAEAVRYWTIANSGARLFLAANGCFTAPK